MGTRRILVAGVLGTTLALGGCSLPPSFSEDEKREMRDSASGYQQAVLEDLVVTETEYRDAIDATRACLQDKGFGVGPTTEQDGNQLGFESSYSGEGPPSNRIMRACDEEFMTAVGPIWVSQQTLLTS